MRSVLLFILFITATATRADDKFSLQQVYDINLPVIEIETVDGELPTFDVVFHPDGAMGVSITNATKVPARLRMVKGKGVLFDSGDYQEKESGITIKVRGNTTARFDKKPYKIKLQKKADLLLRGDEERYADKDWLLILDESLSAKTAFKLNELAGMAWTPAYTYVNLILNGEYLGLYMLCEAVERNKSCRVNVDKTGYLFEYDAYWWNEKVYVESTREGIPMHYTFKYPDADDITEEQLNWFEQMIHQAEAAMKDGTYEDYIDVKSFATWILLHDILGSQDAAGSNYYLMKYDETAQSKIQFALIWDFDMIFICQEEWSVVHQGGWYFYNYLFDDQKFIQAFIDRWKELSPTLFDQLFSYLEAYAASDEGKAFDEAVGLDNQLWGQERKTANVRTRGIISWLTRQKAWIDNAVAEMASTISGMESVNEEPKGNDCLYNLQGQRISQPQKGIYLKNGRKFIRK